MDKEYELNI